jgi:hypothetical protein
LAFVVKVCYQAERCTTLKSAMKPTPHLEVSRHGKPKGDWRVIARAHLVFWLAPVLAGCASNVGQVKEIEPGTYKIGVGAAGNSVLVGGNDALSGAVEQAAQYCRAKGQKLVIVPTPGRDVTFRCGDNIKPDDQN